MRGFNNISISISTSKLLRWAWHVTPVRGIRNPSKIVILRSEGKRPFMIRRCKCVYKTEKECREIACEFVVQM